MEFSFTPLGVSAAQPAYGRHLAGHVLSAGNELFLLDCGEGTQFQFNRYGVKRNRIRHIFISHLHGDHFFGLIGLLTSMGMNDRQEPLTVYSPPGLEQIIRLQLQWSGTQLPYALTFLPVDSSRRYRILETNHLEVDAFPLDHRTPCAGFLFREKPIPLNIIPEVIEQYGLSFEQIREIKEGAGLVLPDGQVVANRELTLAPYRPRSFAYCSDTAFSEAVAGYVEGVDLLYHESTFLEEDAGLAAQTWHSTARQAAEVARLAGAAMLVIGHYSARYPDVSVLLQEAGEVFRPVVRGEEGVAVSVPLVRISA
ncbi:MAG: ribonuclease Z [Lewinellaceae bacterium]|nr:ribonuclease Z [Lewinellaceae bacterium]